MENNERKITLSMDREQIRKEVYAESACIALMSPERNRPEIITNDNRALVNLFIDNAFADLSASLSGFIDNEAFSLPDGSQLIRLPLAVQACSAVSADSLRRIAERALAAYVLADCYEAEKDLETVMKERYRTLLSRLRQLLAPSEFGRRSCWL